MKKAFWIASACISLTIISSCSKVYDCNCITEITDTVTKETYKKQLISKKRENSKAVAKAKCEQESVKYYLVNEKYTTTCGLENKK